MKVSGQFYFFLRKDFTRIKPKQATFTQTFFTRVKSIKSTKSTKLQTSDFLF